MSIPRCFLLAVFPILILLLSPSNLLAQDDEEMEEGDMVLDLDSLTGKERVEAILKLCASQDREDAVALVSVLAEPQETDSEEILRKVFEALLRLRNKEIREELEKAMNNPDPVAQGYTFRVYARTFGPEGGGKLLSLLPEAQGTARKDMIVALRDCPGPKTIAALQSLAGKLQDEEENLQLYVSLLRLGDPKHGDRVFGAYASACDAIRSLTEGLKYPDDPRKAKRSQVRIKQLIALKAEVRGELAIIPKESIPGFAAGAAKSSHPDVWSLLARLLPKLFHEDTVVLFQPLLHSPSIEVATLTLEALAACKDPEAAARLRPEIERLSGSPHPELRKAAVRCSRVLGKAESVSLAQRLLSDSDKWVQIECIEGLAEWSETSVGERIEVMAQSTGDPDIRWSAEYAQSLLKR